MPGSPQVSAVLPALEDSTVSGVRKAGSENTSHWASLASRKRGNLKRKSIERKINHPQGDSSNTGARQHAAVAMPVKLKAKMTDGRGSLARKGKKKKKPGKEADVKKKKKSPEVTQFENEKLPVLLLPQIICQTFSSGGAQRFKKHRSE